MRLHEGRAVVVRPLEPLWHLTADGDETGLKVKALCGLRGPTYRLLGVKAERRCCPVCLTRAQRLGINERNDRGHFRGVPRKISDEQLEALYRLYVERKWSVRKIAEQVWEQFGYKSQRACTNALHSAFRQQGYELRDRIEASIIASTKHGLAAKHGPRIGYARYKRERHELYHGKNSKPYRPTCKGVKTTSPNKGKPCTRPAMAGSDYCWGHDPGREQERVANMAAMRANHQLHGPLVEWPEWKDELRYVYDLVGAEALAEALELKAKTIVSYLSPGREQVFTVERKQRWQAAFIELTAEQLAA
jgi:hypothetical protein